MTATIPAIRRHSPGVKASRTWDSRPVDLSGVAIATAPAPPDPALLQPYGNKPRPVIRGASTGRWRALARVSSLTRGRWWLQVRRRLLGSMGSRPVSVDLLVGSSH